MQCVRAGLVVERMKRNGAVLSARHSASTPLSPHLTTPRGPATPHSAANPSPEVGPAILSLSVSVSVISLLFWRASRSWPIWNATRSFARRDPGLRTRCLSPDDSQQTWTRGAEENGEAGSISQFLEPLARLIAPPLNLTNAPECRSPVSIAQLAIPPGPRSPSAHTSACRVPACTGALACMSAS
jgi:hypothetical protein